MKNSQIFIAWSGETRAAAEVIKVYLQKSGLQAWTSNDIEGGVEYKIEIREVIRNADVVIAVFPRSPSRWQVAEAGLAYFEQKLVPVLIDRAGKETQVVEPFNDLNAIFVSEEEIAEKQGESLEKIQRLIMRKLGLSSSQQWFIDHMHRSNRFFSRGAGIAAVMLIGSLTLLSAENNTPSKVLHLISGHVILGAIVFGGAVFTSLVFARAGATASFSDRRFGFQLGETLFTLWLPIALIQFVYGAWITYGRVIQLESVPGVRDLNVTYLGNNTWLVLAGAAYLISILCFVIGFVNYKSAKNAVSTRKDLNIITRLSFVGNCWFGWGLLFLTSVIMLMNLKGALIP